jgi:hypothetical protein
MSLPREKAWFPVKTYGWGWGLPLRWQGWATLIAFIVALSAGSALVAKNPLLYLGYVLALAAVLIGICYWKGEKPGWHWGDDR